MSASLRNSDYVYNHTGRNGNYIITYTGRKFWPTDPRPEDVHIEDIAHHLSMICRFTGACNRHYSVAAHSLLVSKFCRPENQLWGLLHDAAEAYLADVASPIKREVGMARFEDPVLSCIAEKFGLPPEIPEDVHLVDRQALLAEWYVLMPREWYYEQNTPCDPEMARFVLGQPESHLWNEKKFLREFRRLLEQDGRSFSPGLAASAPATSPAP